jgi:hypothetical protein
MVKKLGGVLIWIAIVALLSVEPASAAARAFEVRCYDGSHQAVGTLSIFDISMAATACNRTFNVCEGSCTGCFIDVNYREVCIDSMGQAYYD